MNNDDFHTKKGKLNKIKLGQKVRAKQRLVDWHAGHLAWGYGKKPTDNAGYSEGEKEIPFDSLVPVYFWALVKLSRKMPIGTVTGYGADGDWDEKTQKEVRGRKCIWVQFFIKSDLGNCGVGTYVSEKDVEVVKKKKR